MFIKNLIEELESIICFKSQNKPYDYSLLTKFNKKIKITYWLNIIYNIK